MILPLVPPMNRPHVILPGVYSLDCNYGPDRNKLIKWKWVDRKTKEKDVDHNQTVHVQTYNTARTQSGLPSKNIHQRDLSFRGKISC